MRRLRLFNYPTPFTGLNTFVDPQFIKDGQSPGEYNVSHYRGLISPAFSINFFSFPGTGTIYTQTDDYPQTLYGTGTAFTSQFSLYSPLYELRDMVDIGNLLFGSIIGITDDTHATISTGGDGGSLSTAFSNRSYNIFQVFPSPIQIIKLDNPYMDKQYYFAISNKWIYELNSSSGKWYATFYAVGTLTTDGTIKTIVGNGTQWTKYVTPNSAIVFGGVAYTVKSITDDTHIVLSDTDPVPPQQIAVSYKVYLNTNSTIATTTVFLNNGANTYYVAGNGGIYKYDPTNDCFYVFTPTWAAPTGTPYTTGTITTNGTTTTVTGSSSPSTAWISQGHVVPGSIIQINGINFIVQTVTSDTSLTVNFVPPQVTNSAYKIYLPQYKIVAAELVSTHYNHLIFGRVTREGLVTDNYNLYFSDINNDIIWGGDGTTNDADIVSFQTTTDQIQMVVPLYQYLVVFKANSIYLMTYQGLPLIYTSQQINSSIGALYPFSVVPVNNLIFFIGNDNVYVFDGNNTVPIATEIVTDIFSSLSGSTNVQGIYDYNTHSYTIAISTTNGNPYIYSYNTLTKSWYKLYSSQISLTFTALGYYNIILSALTWQSYNVIMEASPFRWNQLMETATYQVPIGAIKLGDYSFIVTYGQTIVNGLNAFYVPFLGIGVPSGKPSQMQYWISKPFSLSEDGRPVRMERIRFNQPSDGRKCRLYCTLYYGDDRSLQYSISQVVDLNTTNFWDFSVKGVWFQLSIDADGGTDNITGYDISGIEFYWISPSDMKRLPR